MGFDAQVVRFILKAHNAGVRFHHTGTLGRQGLHVASTHMPELLGETGHGGDFASFYPLDPNWRQQCRALPGESQYAFSEEFLKYLGAETVTSFDASDFECATVIHDFNKPLPFEYRRRFSVFIDAGTIEHIFNFPMAFGNCMEAVAYNGHLISVVPANNFCGHGFYQFSPEAIYAALSPENGFAVRSMVVAELTGKIISMENPRDVKRRVEPATTGQAYLMTLAQRVEVKPLFAEWPQQADYLEQWK